MKDIKELNIIKFPDGHKHLKLDEKDLELEKISISIKSFDDLFLLAQLREICNIKIVRINYLLGARCDRQFSGTEAEDLKIVARFINNLAFNQVQILKPHSQRSLQLIRNSVEISVTKELLQQCIIDNNLAEYSIISPDKGASQWITKELGTENVVQCNKIRENGVVKSVTFEGEVKEVSIIVDDLCSRGGTFVELAKNLKAKGAKEIYLITTHFDEGTELWDSLQNLMTGGIWKFYTTNSFTTCKEDEFIKIMNIK